MTMRPSWPGPTNGTSTTDARIDLAGLIEGTTAGVARAGLFPSNLGAIVTARSDMNVNVAAFQGAAVQFGGPVLLANDGTMQLPSVLVSPASGTNYYVVYAKQNEQTAPGTDANNLTVLGAALSTTSFALARAAMPTGALELATVQVPAGVAATNAGGVTITQTAQFTVAEGGTLPVRNSTELAAWAPADGSMAWQIDQSLIQLRVSGAWTVAGGLTPICVMRRTNATLTAPSNAYGNLSATAAWTSTGGAARGVTYSNGITITQAGWYEVFWTLWLSGSNPSGLIGVAVNASGTPGGNVLHAFGPVVAGSALSAGTARGNVYLNVGDVLTLWGYGNGATMTIEAPSTTGVEPLNWGARWVAP
ncbi:hypothetical protein [Microbacterium sp. 13-71-7]|jgi:hypothetical protein|uniref:hypothetical protein n=1 Tax=Microbacterium sp. 13-71-7 TaxID=1970399 RepID=UPI000BDBFBC3|nr:hypothetical protein [Microbacterium sp. 13-71-7]OZB81736.1 MAG: hypothetical protein B7X32_15865 [Microbacterium sp. 13-71-7]